MLLLDVDVIIESLLKQKLLFGALRLYAALEGLLQKLENKDVNLRAATTFSLNDFISNGGIVIAGVLVMWLGMNWPDLVVGLATAAIQLWGGIKILRDAKQDARKTKDNQNG